MLKTIESVLARHPAFGSSAYIHEQAQICYRRRLGKISAYLPVAGHLLNALERAPTRSRHDVLGDTVVRCAIQHALKQCETKTQYGFPLDECERVFRATIEHLEDAKQGSPLEAGMPAAHRLGSEPCHGWIWSEEHSNDIFGRCFRRLIQDNYGESLYTPTREELACLAKGAQLLGELLPYLSHSALDHSRLIAVFPAVGNWRGKASSSQFRMSGTVLISRELLQSPWKVAELLFHESLHQKLYDFRHSHSLLEPNYCREDAPRVCAIWNVPDKRKSNYWDTHRTVVAFHVYVHLGLLSTLAEERASELAEAYGPLPDELTMIESRKALDRAHYLGGQIKELCWQELGLAGRQLIDWLLAVLEVLDPAPPPQGSRIHLLLDLYRRDANKVEALLGREDITAYPDLLADLTRLMEDEVKSARRVLCSLRAEAELRSFDLALTQYTDEEMGTRFSQVRRLISETLLELPRSGYLLKRPSPAMNPEEALEQMVHGSSQHLDELLATYG